MLQHAHPAGYKDWTTAVKVWYDEESMYDYSAGQFSHETGHFTAMVSNSSAPCCMLVLVQQDSSAAWHAAAKLEQFSGLAVIAAYGQQATPVLTGH